MDIILIPGLWLHGDSWDRVVPHLTKAGHRVATVTPPGHNGEDPAGVTYGDLVASIVNEIDHASGPAIVVGHSAHCAAAWAATDRRVERVSAVVLIGGFPAPDGAAILEGFDTSGGVVPFVGWEPFAGDDTRDLDDTAKAELEAMMSPAPAGFTEGPQTLGDDRRHDVPVVMVCPEYSEADVRQWMDGGGQELSELTTLHNLRFVDLNSGHWPQWSRPEDTADAILSAVSPIKVL